nr:MAG TPA: Sarcolipin [Caudoviricetes sp.]
MGNKLLEGDWMFKAFTIAIIIIILFWILLKIK